MSDCPKAMTYGPCGGVTRDLGCEVDDRPCPFADRPVHFDARQGSASPAPQDAAAPRLWVDFRPDPTNERELGSAVERLAAHDVGVLVGEHVDDPTPHPPARVARSVAGLGIATISTLTCRNRTADDHCEQIEAMKAAGVHAVHCVTGDHPRARLGLDVWPTFPLDGTQLAHLAAGHGARVSVAESPASPPVGDRVRRLLSKQDAGAAMAILNHAGSAEDLAAFAQECRRSRVTLDLVAPVPVITDHHSAEALARFPGLRLPPGFAAKILGSDDPERTGIDAAASMAGELLASGVFSAVNLSGAGADGGLVARATLMSQIAGRIDVPTLTTGKGPT